MRHLKPILAVAIVMLALAMPSISHAQYQDERLNNFINQRPDLKRQLEQNPNLIYNRQWREKHPDLQSFMQNHSNVWGKLANSGRYGAYGPDHNWHDSDWWHQNNPNWMYQNHPEWAQNHPDWRGDGDGDFDENHQWRDRSWWNDHHPDWVNKHHPDWYKHPYEHPIAAEEHKHQMEQQHDHHDHGDHDGQGHH